LIYCTVSPLAISMFLSLLMGKNASHIIGYLR
jgi:hypothetical protein